MKSAVQFSPPLAGTGLLHSRLLDLVPVPHVLLHVAHADHKPNPPSTINKTKRGQTNRWLVLKRRVELGWIQQYNVQFLCPLASPVWMGIYEKEFALKYSQGSWVIWKWAILTWTRRKARSNTFSVISNTLFPAIHWRWIIAHSRSTDDRSCWYTTGFRAPRPWRPETPVTIQRAR